MVVDDPASPQQGGKDRPIDPRPVLLVGTQRSGTTWLSKVLSEHPDAAFAPEPRPVWVRGNAYKPDDRLTAADATPGIVARIHRAFNTMMREQGKPRLVEKTPSNCLRVPFLRAVYPQARILLVLRDGRSVVHSTADLQMSKGKWRNLLDRAKQMPPQEWPAETGRVLDMVRRRVLGQPMPIWGPRPPGWRQWVRDDHPDIVRAKQWSATILTAYRDAQALIEQAETNGEDPGVLIFRYEDLVSDPGPTLERILAFAELRDDGLSQHFAGSVDHARFAKRKDANTSEQLERMKPYLEPALIELGYTW